MFVLPLEAHFHSQLFERFPLEICNDQDPHLTRQKIYPVFSTNFHYLEQYFVPLVSGYAAKYKKY